ncbi:hypothetical protein LQ772_06855 [Frateuria edaphi]|uniref:baseplate hub protein n=1 Tax=Frateuria edaphi TaxID=2898793 RepID=UPI001E288484|nr:hypothetical protein [Frateuria edaphi]UGB47005.1 hypothetical protein LQ772_06855 [Frateuria edaphi]
MTKQYLRKIELSVSGIADAYDLSDLHVEFQVNNAIVGTPKWATLRIWNLGPDKATQIIREFTGVTLAVGYADLDAQRIIAGEIAQVAYGRENAVDTYLDLMVQDADRALLWGTISKSLDIGWTDDQVLDAVLAEWGKGPSPITLGHKPAFKGQPAGDAIVLHGALFDVMEELAHRQDCNWFVEDQQLYVVPKAEVMADDGAPVLTPESGLLGTPVLTYQGIQGRCLMNPAIKVGRTVRLRNADITQLALKSSIIGITDPASIVPTLNNPIETYGTYKVLAVTHEGNSRENQWETRFVCCDVDNTAFTGGPGLVSVPSGGAL